MVKIMSMEHEYGLAHKLNKDHKSLAYEIYNSADEFSLVENYNPSFILRKHLKNGSQIYVDCGHIEIALPECSNPRDVVLYDQAAASILKRIANEKNILVFKNNLDSEETSFGCHENYSLDAMSLKENLKIRSNTRSENFHPSCMSKISHSLIPFLITRPIIAGSGYISNNRYLLSQRATAIEIDVSSNTLRDRAIINTKNEPFSKTGIRMHLISGDSNISEYTNYLKIGATSLVLTMIEQGIQFPEIIVENPIKTLKEINHKKIDSKINGLKIITKRPGLGKYFSISEEISSSPLEIQGIYLRKAKEFLADNKNLSPPWAEKLANEWEFVLNSLQKDSKSLNKHIDWVIKKFLIIEYIKSNKIKIYSEKAKKIDLCYHLISNKGGFDSYNSALNLEKIVTSEEIKKAINSPPNDTRAYGRTKILELLLKENAKKIGFSWDFVYHSGRNFQLPEPYESYSDSYITYISQ